MRYLLAVLLLCGFVSIAHAQQRPPGVICVPSGWTPTAEPPMTGWCMWQPSLYMTPMPANLSTCDARIPTPTGSVDIYDGPNLTGDCARLNWSVGGYFDWLTFQYFGWRTAANIPGYPERVIRSMNIGPNTRLTFGDRALDCSQPGCCDYNHGATCVGTLSSSITETFYDLWSTLPGFKLASMVIAPP